MWLIDQAVLDALEHARGGEATAEQREKFFAIHGDGASNPSRILSVAGNNAEIAIEGVLTKIPDFFAQYFGGGNVTYGEIIQAIAQANADPNVDNITMRVDSPGGMIDGLFEAIKAVRGSVKPIKAIVSDMATSAAFALVAQADSITAENAMSRFGSVGIVTAIKIPEDEVLITSTKAPLKAPDVTTAKGIAEKRKELDAVHDVFVSAIAEGRGTTEEKVNSNFGKGASLLASDALSRGMIDAILDDDSEANESTARTSSGQSEDRAMNTLEEFRAEHPALYAEAVALGVAAEGGRVKAHVKMGVAFGATDIAMKAIAEGTEFGPEIQAEYMSAGQNRDSLDDAAEDDKTAAAATDGATKATDENAAEAEAELIAAGVAEDMGYIPPKVTA